VSWDLYLDPAPCAAPCSHCNQEEYRKIGNYTHNTNDMLMAIWAGAWSDFNGFKARDVLPKVDGAIAALRSDPSRFDAMNPSNGWGSREGLVCFLGRVRTALAEEPDSVFRASA
jgi:hypothetical protein